MATTILERSRAVKTPLASTTEFFAVSSDKSGRVVSCLISLRRCGAF